LTHRAENIMQTVFSLLGGLTTTGENISRGRSEPLETLPALVLEQGEDQIPEGVQNLAFIRRVLNLKIIAYVKTNAQFDTALNQIREEVYFALMADRSQGLDFVIDTNPLGDEEPEISGDAEKNIGRQVMNFSISYRHSLASAGA